MQPTTSDNHTAAPVVASAPCSASGALERVQAWLYRLAPSPYVDSKTGLTRKDVSIETDVQLLLQELIAYRRGGLTEEILRRGDGYIKVGHGCAIVAASSLPNAEMTDANRTEK